MKFGKTVQMYLADGTPTGVRHAEILNWTGQAVAFSRGRFSEVRNLDQLNRPGVYFLFGMSDETDEPQCYIGHSDSVMTRLSNHLSRKDFWNEAIVFTSKDENLTKAHAMYLESRLYELALDAKRYQMENSGGINLPSLSESQKAPLEEYIVNLKLLLGTLGHLVLEPVSSRSANESIDPELSELTFTYKDIVAHGAVVDEGFLVFKGSGVTEEIADYLPQGLQKRKAELFSKRIISADESGSLTLSEDTLFTSPSNAAAILSGKSQNGRIAWKTKDGVTLKEIEESLGGGE